MNNIIRLWARPLLRDRYIYITCFLLFVLYVGCHQVLLPNHNYGFQLYANAFIQAIWISATIFASVYFLYMMVRREPHPLRVYARLLVIPFRQWPETLNFILLVLVLSVVISIFTTLKTAVPAILPFYLDPWLAKLDYMIHFGHMPWELTHALFSGPVATSMINLLYNLWFFILWVYLIVFMCLVNKPALRQQVLICFCLSWIINGNILAILFSSAGPCFYSHLYPDSHLYTDLMTRLTQQNEWLLAHDYFANVWAIYTQNDLWKTYITNADKLGAGISAMPSIHVTTAVLIALSISSYNKKWGVVAWIYALFIQIGSVHLAWHYAVDGYFALLTTCLIWVAVRKCLNMLPDTHVSRQLADYLADN